jgi:hypothetical protein
MKIFIRDTGEENGRRQNILAGIQRLLKVKRVGLAINERDDDIKLFLYHISDIPQNRSEHEAIKKQVLQDKTKLLVEYSGTILQAETLSNIWRVPPNILLNNLARFVVSYIEEGTFRAEILLGYHPIYEAAVDLLNKFFPLDIQLQLGDPDKCKKAARVLLQDSEIRGIGRELSIILRRPIIYREGRFKEEDFRKHCSGSGEDPLALVNGLIELSRLFDHNSSGSSRSDLSTVFGLTPQEADESLIGNLGSPILKEDGYHRRYERLRDRLFAIVEEQNNYDGPHRLSE